MISPNIVIAVVAVLFTAVMASNVAAGTPDELPKQTVPHFMGVNLKPHNFDEATLQRVHDMGFGIVRRGIYWNSVEKEKGVYNFDDYDAPIKKAKELGLKLNMVLFSRNKLYDDARSGFPTEEARKGFAAFAAAAAERYRDLDIYWEIWNEPNTMTFWGKHGKGNTPEYAAEYTALVKEVVPAILKADPDAFITAGSVSNYWSKSYEWTEYCFERGILDAGFHAWSVHPYGVKTPEEFAEGHTITRNLLIRYGKPDMPIINTERGFAVKQREEGWSGGSKERAKEFQAWHFVRQFMIDQLNNVPLTVWYEWDGDVFGIVAKDDPGAEPYPVQRAATTMLAQLNGYRVVNRAETDNELDYIVVMENDQQHQKLVVWTAPPPAQAPDAFTPHRVSIQLPNNASSATIADVYGTESTIATRNGAISIEISGSPQYITPLP